MKRTPFIRAAAFVSAALFVFCGAVSAEEAAAPEVSVELLTLPRGDAERGREAFLELKCYSCHRVPGDYEMPAPVAGKRGPDLGVKQTKHEWVVFPSHPAAEDTEAAGKGSRMGDFSDSMSVHQLTDIIAYLKSLDSEE